ncbi:MAG TPA: ABC transporter substrate-binding protein [Smithellaceae bacterium]|nr:ABC transporter substrate-binding protein [Smithellaceae bacterium]
MKVWKTFFCLFVLLVLARVPSASAQDVVIGFSGPLSGPGGGYGQDCSSGIELAVKEISSNGGLTIKGRVYRLRLERLDDRMDPTQAVSNAHRFVAQYKSPVIFSPTSTAVGALARINQIPGSSFLLAAYTSIHTYHDLGNRLLVNPTTDFLSYINAQSDQAWKRGWRSGAMVVTFGAYGDAWRRAFKQVWKKKGGRILGDFPVNYYTETDFSAPLASAIAAKPDFLLIGGPSATTALVVEQARGMGFKGGFIVTDQAKLDAIARMLKDKHKMDQMIGLGSVSDLPLPAVADFRRKYSNAFKRPPSWEAALHYSMMHVLARAMVQAETVNDPLAIRKALEKILPVAGDVYPSELFGIGENGVIYCGGVIQSVDNGAFSKTRYFLSFPKTREEFEKYKQLSKTREPENIRWWPIQ